MPSTTRPRGSGSRSTPSDRPQHSNAASLQISSQIHRSSCGQLNTRTLASSVCDSVSHPMRPERYRKPMICALACSCCDLIDLRQLPWFDICRAKQVEPQCLHLFETCCGTRLACAYSRSCCMFGVVAFCCCVYSVCLVMCLR